MATVIQVPGDPRFGKLGAAIGGGVTTAIEDRKKEEERKELANWIQTAQQSGSREELTKAPLPRAFKGAQGAIQYSSILDSIHPQKSQEYFRPPADPTSTDPRDLESIGRFRSGQQPEGAVSLDAAKLVFKVPTGVRKGTKDTPKGLKFRVLKKKIANDVAEREGKPLPFKLTKTENRLVESEFADPTRQAALKIALESREFFKIKESRKQMQFIDKIRTQLESNEPLSDVMSAPPGISDADIKAILANPNQAGKTQEQIVKELWDGYDAGKRY